MTDANKSRAEYYLDAFKDHEWGATQTILLERILETQERIADALDVLAGQARYKAMEDYEDAKSNLAYWLQHEPEKKFRIEEIRSEIAHYEAAFPWLKEQPKTI